MDIYKLYAERVTSIPAGLKFMVSDDVNVPAFSAFIFYAVAQRLHFIQVCQLLLLSDLSLHFLSFIFEYLKHKETGWEDKRIILSFLQGRRT
jgi:hypothetical protein